MEKEELNRHREAESQARGGAGDSGVFGGTWGPRLTLMTSFVRMCQTDKSGGRGAVTSRTGSQGISGHLTWRECVHPEGGPCPVASGVRMEGWLLTCHSSCVSPSSNGLFPSF